MYITRKVSHNPSVIQLPLPETLKMAESQKSDSQEWKKPKVYKLKKEKWDHYLVYFFYFQKCGKILA